MCLENNSVRFNNLGLKKKTFSKEDGRYLLETSPEGSWLVIRLVSPEDQGIYTCQVVDDQNKGSWIVIRLVSPEDRGIYTCQVADDLNKGSWIVSSGC